MAKARLLSKDKGREKRLTGSCDGALDQRLSEIVKTSVKSAKTRVTEIVERHLGASNAKEA